MIDASGKRSAIRLNRYIQRNAGISRRAADELIRAGRVTVDGKAAKPGMLVVPGQLVAIDGKPLAERRGPHTYIVMNKPVGYICSRRGHRTIFELLPERFRALSYVGRLDVGTSGTLILTDDGSLANALMRSNAPRVYRVVLSEPLSPDAEELLRRGPMLDGREVKLGAVEIEGRRVRLELFEGRWREVRRIFSAMGFAVVSLHRESFGGVSADDLPPGGVRVLSPRVLALLRAYATKKPPTQSGAAQGGRGSEPTRS